MSNSENWKGLFTLFYKTQHRVVKSLSKAKPHSNTLTDEEQWNLINLIEANEYLYDMRITLRGLENKHYSLRDKLRHERKLHDETKRNERHWRGKANQEEFPPSEFLEDYTVCPQCGIKHLETEYEGCCGIICMALEKDWC